MFDNFAANGLNNTVDTDAPDNGVGAECKSKLQPGETSRWMTCAGCCRRPRRPAPSSPAPARTTPGSLPPPVAGKTVNVKVAKGKVLDQAAGLEEVRPAHRPTPGPARHDLRHHERARDADLGGRQGRRDPARLVLRGVFKVGQTKGAKPLTELTLAGPEPSCQKTRARARHAAAKKKPKTRQLWGDGKGAFRTTGQYSSATVRGTRWVVIDTLPRHTHAGQGAESSRCATSGGTRTIVVRAGKQYLARKPK